MQQFIIHNMFTLQVFVLVIYLVIHCALCEDITHFRRSVQNQKEKVASASLIGVNEILPKYLIDKIEEFIAPTLNISTNDLCKNHSEIYIEGLRNREKWAYQMLDSSGKLQSGVLTGNLITMGNFDECIAVSNVQTEFGYFKGKHCLAMITWSNSSFLSTKDLFSNLRIRGMSTSVTVEWGFCIPSTCEAKDLEAGLQDLLYEDISVSVVDMNCHTTTDKEFKIIDYVAIAIFTFFGFLVILCTTYDLLYTEARKEIFLTFSMYTNGKKLLSTKNTADSLPALHGIRFLSICWIVLGHRYMVSTGGPAINLTFSLEYTKDLKSTLVVNSQLGVDTFLLMSGFLVSYVFLKQTSKRERKSFNIFLYYLHRYIRLTPALAVMVLIQLSLIDHLGSGPLWDKNNSMLTQLCKENWWSALLYVQNYIAGDRMCVGHTWYLSLDMQLVWLSPLLLLPLLKWRRRWNLTILGIIILAGVATSFTVIYVNEFPVGVLAGVGPKWDARNKYEYVKTHTRFTPWVVGIALGYILYQIRNKKLLLHKIQVIAGWLVAIVGLLGAVYGLLPFQQPDYNYSALESASFNCLYRTVWAFAVSWVIFTCISGYGGPVNTFLSWTAFLPFSRLSYCIYLVHYTFITYRNFSSRVPAYLNDMNVPALQVQIQFAERFPGEKIPGRTTIHNLYNKFQATDSVQSKKLISAPPLPKLVSLFFGDLAFSVLLAAVLHLVFEVPAISIEKILLKRGETQLNQERDSSRNEDIAEDGKVNEGFATQRKEHNGSRTDNIAIRSET